MIRSVNLIPYARIEARRRRERGRRWVFACVGYCSALVLLWLVVNALWGMPDAATAQQVEDIKVQIEDTRAALDLLHPRLADAQTTLAASRTIGDQPDFSILLSLLANLLDEETVLSDVDITPYDPAISSMRDLHRVAATDDNRTARAYWLRVEGLGRSQSAVSEYVLRLERCGLFKRVHLLDTHKKPFLRDDAVAFRVECLLGEPAPVDNPSTGAEAVGARGARSGGGNQ